MTDKILIVDDEPNNLDVLRNCLREAGFTVSVTKNGETALKRVAHIKPDLILLDILMQGMDGFETCRRFKQNEATKDTPVIFITAVKTGAIDKIKGLEIGAVDYITKPFLAEEVVARVNKHLTISNLRKQLEAQNAQLQDYVYHLESLASLGKVINEAQEVTKMMDKAMQVTLAVFKCDRAWLLYPCDPKAASWRVPVEVTTSKYPGANILNAEIPMQPAISEIMHNALSTSGPIAFGPEYEHKIPLDIAEQFAVQSQLSMAIYPKIGNPWLFGIHQCSHARVWTENEVNLFQEFGQQIAVSLGLSISVEELHKAKLPRERYHDFIGASKPMQTVYQTIDNVATSEVSILLTGETGTGKELCAEAIHKESNRAAQPFIIFDCAVIPKELMESQLFGHVKGAFTNAINDRQGAALQADGGTLFLDEIGEIPLDLQSTLLRFIQTKTFRQVGSDKVKRANIRLICATNRNLLAEIEAGRFREDLYYRLDTIEIKLPALRKRKSDILLLAKCFLQKFVEQEHKNFQKFSAEAEQKLLSYKWPGNVRQLQNTIRNVVLLNEGKVITVEMLKAKIGTEIDEVSTFHSSDNLSASKEKPNVALTSDEVIRPFEEIEQEVITKVIEYCDGNVYEAAKSLGIGKSTLYRKQQKWKPITS